MASKTFLDGIEYISPYKGFGYVYDRHGHLKNQMQEEVTQNDFVSFADHFYRFFSFSQQTRLCGETFACHYVINRLSGPLLLFYGCFHLLLHNQ